MPLDISDVSITDLPPITGVADLAEATRLDPADRNAVEERAMWRMTPDERIAAAERGELRGRALRTWAATRPYEVPNTSLLADHFDEFGIPATGGSGEYPWILRHTPEYCED